MTSNKTTCVIDSIVAKQDSAFIIYEDNDFISFLDKHPLFIGHCLLAPKEHFTTLYDLPQSLITNYFSLAQTIDKAIEIAMDAEGSFMAINNTVSQSIAHLHLHIVPRNKGDGLKGFFWPRTKYLSEQHSLETQEKIIQALSQR